MKKQTKDIVTLFGVTFNLGLSCVLVATFYIAFFNGGEALVRVNAFGEANVEFVLLIPVIITGFVGTVFVWRSIVCREKKDTR